jgi:hypothetical protein
MKRLIFAALIAATPLTLTACDFGALQSPGSVANRTVLDEQIGSAVELAYKAARTAMETAVDAGLIKGALATKVALADNKAFAATQAVQRAYRAGNASNYAVAATQAQAAIGEFLAAIKG